MLIEGPDPDGGMGTIPVQFRGFIPQDRLTPWIRESFPPGAGSPEKPMVLFQSVTGYLVCMVREDGTMDDLHGRTVTIHSILERVN